MNKIIKLDFPISRPYCGMAMGNGNAGILIWGDKRLHITVNRGDFWDRRGGAQPEPGVTTYERVKKLHDPNNRASLAEAFPVKPRPPGIAFPSRLPVGRFELEFAAEVKPVRAELHLSSGFVQVFLQNERTSKQRCLCFVLSHDRPLLWIQDPDRAVKRVHACPSWKWCADWMSKIKFRPPREIDKPGLVGWIQNCPDDPALAALCASVQDGWMLSLTVDAREKDAFSVGQDLLHAVAEAGVKKIADGSTAWWREYWRKTPRLKLPDKEMENYYLYSAYLFGCATSPCGGIAAGLQGAWIDETHPVPWGGDYHFNCNVQLIYTPALHLNHPEHLLPLFDMVDSWWPTLRRNAKIMCGIDDGILLGMLTDDRGRMLYGGAGVLLDHAASGWTAQLYWLYYRYTGDLTFLRERAWPFMCGVMRVYETMLEERNGRLSLPVGISAEYGNLLSRNEGKSNCGRDPSWQLACIHMLADALSAAAAALGEHPSPAWHEIKTKLPPYALVGESENEHIGIWEGLDLEVSHRHHSHLAGIYPFDTINAESPEHRAIISRTIKHWVRKGMGEWCSFSLPWAAMLLARLDHRDSAELMLSLWKRLYLNEGGMGVNGAQVLGIHVSWQRPGSPAGPGAMQLDGVFAGISALLEMFVHTRGDVLHIGAGVPRRWGNLRVDNLPVPGGFMVSARWENNQISVVKIKSRFEGELKIMIHGMSHIVLNRSSRKQVVNKLPLCMKFARGETVEFTSEL